MSRYAPEMKSAILRAAIAARGAGKKWADALQDAKAAGYRGSLQGIVKMIRAGKRRKRMKRTVLPEGSAETVATAKRKLGRPKGSKNATKVLPGRPIAAGAGLSEIDKIVAQMVEQRVGAAVAWAVKVLEMAVEELRRL